MTELSEELDTEDLDSIKFLLSCKLSREKLEKTKVKTTTKTSKWTRHDFVFTHFQIYVGGNLLLTILTL